MAANMNRLHDMPPGVIEDLDEEYPIGVLGLDAGSFEIDYHGSGNRSK